MVDSKESTEKQNEKNREYGLHIVMGKDKYKNRLYMDYRKSGNGSKRDEKTKQEDWKSYKVELYKRIVRSEAIKMWLIDNDPIVKDEIEGALNSIWEILKKKHFENSNKAYYEKKICSIITRKKREDFEKFRKTSRKVPVKLENIGQKLEDKGIKDLSR
ncbi:9215_t:CDS:2 [Gigaspora margarita]|uniref:9215_t:CDS:1 n=1 Tax=Gigaspora margarita TaxID=4874 RepID=A0ABN7V8V1_GIGMA|nr:9215_t:CDS:2 [Gigaspora margarita]